MTPALNRAGAYQPNIVQPFYTGLSSGQFIPWGAWLIPMAAWISVIFAGLFMTGCLSLLLRAQWSENEALAFPLLKLPLEMTTDDNTGQLEPIRITLIVGRR